MREKKDFHPAHMLDFFHLVIESFGLEKTCKVIESNHKPNTAKMESFPKKPNFPFCLSYSSSIFARILNSSPGKALVLFVLRLGF